MTEALSALSGGPQTTETINDQGEQEITVSPASLTPLRARLVDWLAVGSGFMAGVAGIAGAIHFGLDPLAGFGVAIAAPVFGYFGGKEMFQDLLQKRTCVVFTPEQFIVHGLFGERRFDRNLPSKFTLYVHDKARREEEILSFKENRPGRKWWMRPPKRYYGQSFHLSFDYLDQRHDLMTIYGRKNAQIILARLKACDEVMNGYAGKGNGQALEPESDWAPQSGELLDSF